MVTKRASTIQVGPITAEDGLEAGSLAFPELDFETMDVAGNETYLICLQNQHIYVATQQ